MDIWCSSRSNHKYSSSSWFKLYWLFIIIFLISSPAATFVVDQPVVCIEEERKALLELKASLQDSSIYDRSWLYSSHKLLPTWVGESCSEWERVKCDSTTGHITHLNLSNMLLLPFYKYYDSYFLSRDGFTESWLLNFSIFLPFQELTSLDLSRNRIGVNTEFEMISSLKKLEILNLSHNLIGNDLFPSLKALTSLRILDLGYNNRWTGYHDISEFAALENLEVLDLTRCGYYGTFQMQGSWRHTMLKKLKILNLGDNQFNETLIASLRSLSSLKALDLSHNRLSGLFPAKDLSHVTELEKLDLSENELQGTPSVRSCKRMLRLEWLESILLVDNDFDKSIISCLSFLPSLKTLDLSGSLTGSSFPMQELRSLSDLEVLLLSGNNFNGTLPMEGLASFHNLEVLDLSINNFVGSIPSTIRSLSSLRAVSFSTNALNGSLPPDHGLCELENLRELDLSVNMLDGNLTECFNRLSSLKVFDISSNQFTGTLPSSLIANLTSLEYVDFSHNQFGGSFSFSSFSNLTKLEVVKLKSDNNTLEVETEEPVGWIPVFQLKVLVLSNCNMNRRKGSVSPTFLLYQHELTALDVSHNSLKGQFPIWLIENNTMLDYLNLRNNSIGGSIHMPFYRNVNRMHLDISANFLNGTIPRDMPKQLPNIVHLNLSKNSLDGAIPSSFGNLSELYLLDLSHNELSGEVPIGLLTNHPNWLALILSNNTLHGEVLSGNLSLGDIQRLSLNSNCFTGKIGNEITKMTSIPSINLLDISNNLFTGKIPGWVSNLTSVSELVLRNNRFEGQFPCGTASFSFLDISQNSFSGPIPSCLNWNNVKHLHLGSNRFTGSIPTFFRNLTDVLTLDIRNNSLSGRIPKFIGELTDLRILLLGKNNFTGPIPNQLCQLNKASLIDLSGNSLSGSIPGCLHNVAGPHDIAFHITSTESLIEAPTYTYKRVIDGFSTTSSIYEESDTQDEVLFTTKSMSHPYKGNILDYMSGLDLSCNKLTGEIPPELGMLTQLRALNLSHNQLIGPIPVQFSNLTNIESLDLSSNSLSGNVPAELINLNSLAVFNVSYNNLSGKLPEMKAQFSTFSNKSYEGNPLLCGLPLEKKCTTASSPTEEEEESDEKWYDIDMASFYGSCGSTWFVFMLGFAAVLYTNPYWRRRWLDLVEECMYTCYYFLYDLVRKPSMQFCN